MLTMMASNNRVEATRKAARLTRAVLILMKFVI